MLRWPKDSPCVRCRHFRGVATPKGQIEGTQVFACDAFPEGIPDEILTGANDHTGPFPGDHGIRFEPKPGVDPAEPPPDERP